MLQELLKPTKEPKVVVPDLSVLFKTKALVSSERSTTRDRFDLYVLMTEHGFTIEDYAAAFGEKGRLLMEIGLRLLASGRPTEQPRCPGAASAREHPGGDDSFFRAEIRRWELAVAEERFREGENEP